MMDLFEDLPKPSTAAPKVQARRISSSVLNPLPKIDLFGDLPPAAETGAPSSGEKRKADTQVEATDGSGKRPETSGNYVLRGYSAERKGEREDMQDRHVIFDNFNPEVVHADKAVCRLAYYGVFDGHGGHRASQYAASHLHRNLAQRFPKGDPSKLEAEVKRCFIESFKKTNEDFLKEASKKKPSWKDGTTAVTVLAINNTLYIGNLGDSKAVLCRYNEADGKWGGIPLTKDHNPTNYEERMRIQKAGGHVRDGRVMGILEVSRSLGDGPYKKHGVSCLPDVKRCQLTDADRYILIACDGLWKRFDNESAIVFINKIIQGEGSKTGSHVTPEESKWECAVNRLANEAVRRLSADNVTVLLVSISKPR